MCCVRTIPFSQDSRLENELVPHGEVSNLQVLEQLINNVAHVLVVAHGEQQVQTAPPDADVWILQRGHNALLMPAAEPRYMFLWCKAFMLVLSNQAYVSSVQN